VQESDESLIERLKNGDEAAVRALHRRYAALVFTIASRALPPANAEDIVQDVFVTLWTKHATFDPTRGSFKSWLVRIAKNRTINELRRLRVRGEGDESAIDALETDALAPDEAQWAERKRTAVRTAVDALPEVQRRALSLAFFDELSHEQVAAAMGTPMGTVKTRIRAGMKKIAPWLAALVTAIALFVAWRRGEREAKIDRALTVVTSSDTVPLRLSAIAGAPNDAHGQYRARAGSRTIVLTTTRLPQLASGERYVAWARHGTRWTKLGTIDAVDRFVLVAEDDALAAPPDEVKVTRERASEGAPSGEPVVAWP
jgi:RNA polymerase sigma-70 factor (ECF subfamily)